MNPWDVLQIKPTSDKTAIKKAYAIMLKRHHPEDDPEGFIQVRTAYQDALKTAERMSGQQSGEYHVTYEIEPNLKTSALQVEPNFKETAQEDEREDNPGAYEKASEEEPQQLSRKYYLNKVVLLYNDVFQRRDLSEWQKLLQEFNIEEYQQMSITAGTFFNNHCCLTHKVWKYLDEQFSLAVNPWFKWGDYVSYDFGLSAEFLDPEFDCDYNRYLLLRFSAFEAFRELDYEKAVTTALDAEKIYPKDAVLYRILGTAYFMLRDYPKAIDSLSKALDLNSFDLDALLTRGNAYLKKGDTALAEADFRQVIRMDNESFEAQKGIILCLNNMNKRLRADRYRLKLNKKSYFNLEIDLALFQFSNKKKKIFKYSKILFLVLFFGPSVISVLSMFISIYSVLPAIIIGFMIYRPKR